MRKIYSLVLIATMLLIGTNAWADGVIKLVRTGATYEHLKEAFEAAQDGDVLELTGDINENEAKAAWLGAPSSGTLENYASPDLVNPQNGYRSITLDLKGHTYYNSGATQYVIALTRGKLRITSTGGEGEIKLTKYGIAVYGTYLKIDAKTQTPFSHLIIDENVKIKEGEKGVVIETLRPYEVETYWNWGTDPYPFDYRCDIFPNSNWGIANGARIDIYGKLETTKYACQVTGNVRSALEFLNSDGTYITPYYYKYSNGTEKQIHFPLYWKKSDTELYLPGTNSPDSKAKETVAQAWSTTAYYDAVVSSSNDYFLTKDDNDYAAYVYIRKSAVLKTNNQDSKSAVGFYSAGYSRVYIEGTCDGSTGLYVKSGDVELHDATITSNYTGGYEAANPTSTGVVAGGSGIVIESNKGYTGNIDATVTGDTYVKGSTGYAIDEAVTNAEGTEVDAITITGGTFVGGGEGTMKLSEITVTAAEDPNDQTTISITGGAVENGQTTITVGDDQIPLTDFLADTDNTNTHITYVTDENNNTTMIISAGDAPAEDPDNVGNTTWAYIASQSNQETKPSYAWTAVEQNQQISSGTIYLGELQINSGSAGNLQELIIHDGATLQVERLIMNAYARIIVKAGGKLIVNGTQGISAPSTQNIVLESTADKQAYFLFNPGVSSNKHPNASVVVSTVCRQTGYSPWTYVYQRIASPLKDILTAAPANDFGNDMTKLYTADATNVAFENYLYHWDMAQEKWVVGPWNQMAPFTGYQLANNSQAGGVKYTFSGKLVGNQDGNYRFAGEGFDFFGNSYTAPIYIENIFAHFNNAGVQASVWVYDYVAGNYITITPLDFEDNGYPTWLHGNNLPLKEIAPFAGFIMKLDDATNGNVAKLNYAAAIWGNPDVNPSAAAPARKSQATADRVTLRVEAANGNADMIKFVQSDRFTEAFDNGADASKYFSENGINLYAVTNDGDLARVATNDLENTVLAFQAGNATEYTISVPAQSGETFMLRDLVTNQTMMMEAGATYAFNQEAYSTNNARFEIVAGAKMPTAIDNTEVKANVKGIYTITGQYVGENFEILPAGVYVVNGVKIVK